MSDKIKTKEDAIGRRKELRDKIKEYLLKHDDIKTEQYDEIAVWNKELDALANLIKIFNEEEEARSQAEKEDSPAGLTTDGLPDIGFDSAGWAEQAKNGVEAVKSKRFEIDTIKFLLTDAPVTRTNWAPESTRFRPTVMQPLRQPSLLESLPTVQVNQMMAVYVRQNSQTNTVAARAEGAEAVEQEFGSTEISTTIPMVSAFTEVTGEEIEDESTILGTIRTRLPLLARVAVDSSLIIAAKAVTGINSITTAANEDRLTHVLDGLTDIGSKVETEADLIVTKLKTYSAVRKITTTDGIYLFGGPDTEGVRSFWGVPVVINNGMADHEILAFSSRAWVAVALKGGARIYVTDSDGTNFKKNIYTLRVDLPALGLWYHSKAITLLDITLGNDTGYVL